MSLLAYAVQKGEAPTVELLLENGADIMRKYLDEEDVVMIASRLESFEILNLLLEHANKMM